MSRLTTYNSNTATTRVVISSFVSALALASFAGCSGSHRYSSSNGQFKPGQASVSINPDATQGSYTSQWYQGEARTVNLPDRWLSEARQSTAEIEARRAAAQAAFVQNQANTAQATADADAGLQGALSRELSSRAQAEMLEEAYSAKLDELGRRADSEQYRNDTNSRRDVSVLDATVMEWESQVEQMRSQGESEWMQALAEHENMLAQRQAVDERGRAVIDQMRRVAELTDSRAMSNVVNLRAEAKSVTEQTAATVKELNQELATTRSQSGARVKELRQQSASLRQDADATVAEFRAQAQALEDQDVEQTFELRMVSSEADFQSAQAETDRLRVDADAQQQTDSAQLDRRNGELNQSIEEAQNQYESQLTLIDSYKEIGLAEITVARADAQRIERQGRINFIKAEAEARARAIREESAHKTQLADDEFNKIKAEAEAQASKIEAQVARTLAQQANKGSKSFPGNTKIVEPGVNSDDATPQVGNVGKRPANVAPDRIAAFKSTLAESAKFVAQADAAEAELFATVDEDIAHVEAQWKIRLAQHDAWASEIDAFARKSDAKVSQKFAQADSLLTSAKAEYARSQVSTESFRKETIASITSLRAQADSVEKKSAAKVSQILAQANTVGENGKSMVRTLDVKRESTLRRGEAKSQQLMAEASSHEVSQKAVVAYMHEQINSSEKIHNSELARLDQAAKSFVAISKATYEEAIVAADVYERVTIASTAEIVANNEASRKIAEADIEYLRNLTYSNQLLAEASVARMIADAEADVGHWQADDNVRRAQIMTDARIAAAAVDEQYAIADAQEQSIRALFDSRITLTQSQRNRAYAEDYLSKQQGLFRTEQAVAAADAYRDLANAAMNRLNGAEKSFVISSDPNWDTRLAWPNPYPTPQNNLDIKNFVDVSFDSFAEVPTDDD